MLRPITFRLYTHTVYPEQGESHTDPAWLEIHVGEYYLFRLDAVSRDGVYGTIVEAEVQIDCEIQVSCQIMTSADGLAEIASAVSVLNAKAGYPDSRATEYTLALLGLLAEAAKDKMQDFETVAWVNAWRTKWEKVLQGVTVDLNKRTPAIYGNYSRLKPGPKIIPAKKKKKPE